MKKHTIERDWLLIIMSVIAAVAIPALLALAFAAISGWSAFFYGWKMCFWMFGAVGVVVAILNFLKILPSHLAYGFGCGLYYGTIGLAALLLKLGIDLSMGWLLPICFVIAALSCYIVYSISFKDK